MYDEIDSRFDLIKKEFEKNDYSTDLITKAYKFAKELHKDQRRKDGKLYISHPVEVALSFGIKSLVYNPKTVLNDIKRIVGEKNVRCSCNRRCNCR